MPYIVNAVKVIFQYFTMYTPTYELNFKAGNQKDYNTEEYIQSVIDTICKYCDFISENKV